MKNIELINPDLKIKLEETKNEIFEYFNEKGINVNDLLPLNEILQFKVINKTYFIYVSEDFPIEYRGIISNIIKKNFPK
ncbi:hypothetical protein [Empedobacter brevis]|uniref:hypothetical protein n=1 Tax=Empedobacter brevis TaxID=247 RepID=UPI0028ACD7E6|nr:hypothetical protein [Empedobacter brevis]